jgi:hypothetical protein
MVSGSVRQDLYYAHKAQCLLSGKHFLFDATSDSWRTVALAIQQSQCRNVVELTAPYPDAA